MFIQLIIYFFTRWVGAIKTKRGVEWNYFQRAVKAINGVSKPWIEKTNPSEKNYTPLFFTWLVLLLPTLVICFLVSRETALDRTCWNALKPFVKSPKEVTKINNERERTAFLSLPWFVCSYEHFGWRNISSCRFFPKSQNLETITVVCYCAFSKSVMQVEVLES